MKVMRVVLLYFSIFYCNNFISACLNKKSDGMSGKAMSIFETFLPRQCLEKGEIISMRSETSRGQSLIDRTSFTF